MNKANHDSSCNPRTSKRRMATFLCGGGQMERTEACSGNRDTDFPPEGGGRTADERKRTRVRTAHAQSEDPKPCQRRLGAPALAASPCAHSMLPARPGRTCTTRVPSWHMQAQMVDVPVRPLRSPLPVMRQPRADTAGTEGAAHVHVPAGAAAARVAQAARHVQAAGCQFAWRGSAHTFPGARLQADIPAFSATTPNRTPLWPPAPR